MVGATGIEPVTPAMSRLQPIDFAAFYGVDMTDKARTETEQNGAGAQIARARSLGHILLYVVQAGPFCKVGITADIQKRMHTYATHCPLPVACVALFEVKAPFALFLEREVHRLLKPHWVRGEWFAIEPAQAIDAVDAAKAGGVPLRSGRLAYPKIETLLQQSARLKVAALDALKEPAND